MEMSMRVRFQIFKNENGDFRQIHNDETDALSIGGFSFDIDEYSIPFDWDAFSGSEYDDMFCFETGTGWFWNDYELTDCYDEDYAEMGLTKEDITAELLSSVHHIEEFFVYFEDTDGKEQGFGAYYDNVDEPEYKVKIIDMVFVDMDTQNEYPVAQEVIDKYNRGEY